MVKFSRSKGSKAGTPSNAKDPQPTEKHQDKEPKPDKVKEPAKKESNALKATGTLTKTQRRKMSKKAAKGKLSAKEGPNVAGADQATEVTSLRAAHATIAKLKSQLGMARPAPGQKKAKATVQEGHPVGVNAAPPVKASDAPPVKASDAPPVRPSGGAPKISALVKFDHVALFKKLAYPVFPGIVAIEPFAEGVFMAALLTFDSEASAAAAEAKGVVESEGCPIKCSQSKSKRFTNTANQRVVSFQGHKGTRFLMKQLWPTSSQAQVRFDSTLMMVFFDTDEELRAAVAAGPKTLFGDIAFTPLLPRVRLAGKRTGGEAAMGEDENAPAKKKQKTGETTTAAQTPAAAKFYVDVTMDLPALVQKAAQAVFPGVTGLSDVLVHRNKMFLATFTSEGAAAAAEKKGEAAWEGLLVKCFQPTNVAGLTPTPTQRAISLGGAEPAGKRLAKALWPTARGGSMMHGRYPKLLALFPTKEAADAALAAGPKKRFGGIVFTPAPHRGPQEKAQ